MDKTLIKFLALSCGLLCGLLPACGTAQIASPVLQRFNPVRDSNIQWTTASSLHCSLPALTQPGDIVVGFASSFNTGNTITPSGWIVFNQTSQGYWNAAYFWKLVTSGDISSGVTYSNGGNIAVTLVDFIPLASGTFTYGANTGTSNPATSAISSGGTTSSNNIFIFGVSYGNYGGTLLPPTLANTSGATPQMGLTLLQSEATGTTGSGSMAVYVATGSGSPWGYTASFPGFYNNGYYFGWASIIQ